MLQTGNYFLNFVRLKILQNIPKNQKFSQKELAMMKIFNPKKKKPTSYDVKKRSK